LKEGFFSLFVFFCLLPLRAAACRHLFSNAKARDMFRKMSAESRSQRATAAILGALCADAACRPLHWVYDTQLLQQYVLQLSPDGNPEFLEESRSPFYCIPTGGLSPYGGALLASLQGAARAPASDAAAISACIQQQLLATFGADDGEWQVAYRRRKVAYDEKSK
jgi:hypothetical protein